MKEKAQHHHLSFREGHVLHDFMKLLPQFQKNLLGKYSKNMLYVDVLGRSFPISGDNIRFY